MTGDIEVVDQSVKVAVADLDAAADTLTAAATMVEDYFVVEPGGKFLAQSSELVNWIRDQLAQQYRALDTTVASASDTILHIWNDFERTDGPGFSGSAVPPERTGERSGPSAEACRRRPRPAS